MTPSTSFLPTTTISGTPISSESLNFTPGETPLPVVEQDSDPNRLEVQRQPLGCLEDPRVLACGDDVTSAGDTSRGHTRPWPSWCCSAMAATARETPTP